MTSSQQSCVATHTGVGTIGKVILCTKTTNGVYEHARQHCKNKIAVLASCLILQLCNYPSYANSNNVVLVKHFVGS